MAKIIKTSGEMVGVEPENGKYFGLEELHSFVDGYIELLYLSDGRLMVVNEEGKLRKQPYNPVASSFAGQHIVGNVLLCEKNLIK